MKRKTIEIVCEHQEGIQFGKMFPLSEISDEKNYETVEGFILKNASKKEKAYKIFPLSSERILVQYFKKAS